MAKTTQLEQEQSKQKSYEELEFELSELKSLMKSFIASQQKQPEVKVSSPSFPTKPLPIEEYVEVHPNTRIKVVSLFDGVLILVAGSYGNGKPYRFEKFGEMKNIVYSDLAEILHYQFGFAEKGLLYICNDNVVSNHGLTDAYQKLLSKEIIDNLLDYNRQDMDELFKNSTEMQKEQVASILARKIANEEDIDLNKVNALSKLYGKNIVDMAEDYKQVQVS